MRSLKLALLATAASAVLSSAAFAADLIVDQPTVAPMVDNSFNWDGAYIGALIQGQTAPNAFALGADLGVNTTMNGLLLGGEIEGTVGWPATASIQGTIKVGGVVDQAAIYAYSGIGGRHPTGPYVPLGAGVEFGVAQNVGLKLEGQYNFDLSNSAENSVAVKAGLNWHF